MAGGIGERKPETMSKMKYALSFIALLFALGLFIGCESTDGGSSSGGSVYYGTGFSDPWYYGGDYDGGDLVVAPPPARQVAPAHPEQPIYDPSGPRPTPLPSVPSAPRPPMRY
jgi:hypothetical protein